MRAIRTYEVTVRGFPPVLYSARSPSKARARCWRDYGIMDDRETKFRDFLAMSSIRRVPDPPGIGERILVAGEPATRVIGWGQYTHFMRDNSDAILLAHPSDVAELPGQGHEDSMSDELIERLRKATVPTEALNGAIRVAFPDRQACHQEDYTGSMDDARTLFPPGWSWSVREGGCYADGRKLKPRAELAEPIETEFGPGVGIRAQEEGHTPAIAMVIAALSARKRIGEGGSP